MTMTYFPTTIINDFFPDPHAVVNMTYSDKIEWWSAPDGSWPGMRSQPIHLIDNYFYNYFINRYLLHFYDEEFLNSPNFGFAAIAYFQRTKTNLGQGWVHSDFPNRHTVIAYLNEDSNPSSGTALYTLKSSGLLGAGTKEEHRNSKQAYYKGEITEEEAAAHRQEHNDQFVQDTFVANKFIRVVGFDSRLWHGVESFDTGTKERLTIILFLHKLACFDHPISKSKSYPLIR